eukprot:Nk52_evm34s236 gene=Nk52_evmTU34s236
MGGSNYALPCLVIPDSLTFYLADRSSHRQIITIYNPFDFVVKFKLLCTQPKNFLVQPSSGTLRPSSTIDVVVRLKATGENSESVTVGEGSNNNNNNNNNINDVVKFLVETVEVDGKSHGKKIVTAKVLRHFVDNYNEGNNSGNQQSNSNSPAVGAGGGGGTAAALHGKSHRASLGDGGGSEQIGRHSSSVASSGGGGRYSVQLSGVLPDYMSSVLFTLCLVCLLVVIFPTRFDAREGTCVCGEGGAPLPAESSSSSDSSSSFQTGAIGMIVRHLSFSVTHQVFASFVLGALSMAFALDRKKED